MAKTSKWVLVDLQVILEYNFPQTTDHRPENSRSWTLSRNEQLDTECPVLYYNYNNNT